MRICLQPERFADESFLKNYVPIIYHAEINVKHSYLKITKMAYISHSKCPKLSLGHKWNTQEALYDKTFCFATADAAGLEVEEMIFIQFAD